MTITSFKFAPTVFLAAIIFITIVAHRDKPSFIIKKAPKERSYFNSFHVLDTPSRMELYVHTEGNYNFDAELYSTITFQLLDSARGFIDHSMFHDTARRDRLIGFYCRDSIDIILNNIYFQCKK